jgi:hypothetical protein
MPRVSKKSVAVAEPAPAPAPVVSEPSVKKAGARFGKMTEEHREKIATLGAEHSKHFKSSLRGNLMVGKSWEEAVVSAKAFEAKKASAK